VAKKENGRLDKKATELERVTFGYSENEETAMISDRR
jgi:hypothetical protein